MGWYQTAIPPTPSQVDLTGQTIAVTGANTGLGFEAARQLLRLRASTLILGVRSIQRGEEARLRLLEDAEVRRVNAEAVVEVLHLDLIDYESVVSFADAVQKLTARLDVLLLNAGINLACFRTSPAGHETLMQVNYLSNALLTFLLLPHLSTTSPTSLHKPTIAWVGSMAQGFNSLGKLSGVPSHILDRFSDPNEYSAFSQYPNSKMFVAMFVRSLAEHLKDTNVVVNNLCPGTVDTAADDNLPFYLRIPLNLNRRLRARTVEEGARTLIFASVVAGSETHGKYIANNKVSPLATYADTPSGRLFSEQLWQETLQECAGVDSRVEKLGFN